MNTTAKRKTLGFFLVIVVSGLSAEATEICLRSQVAARGSIVLLGDVADIKADSDEQRAELARRELFPAPNPGQSRLFRQQEIRGLLELHGLDTQTWKFSGARLARITGGAAVPREIRELDSPAEPVEPVAVVTRRALARGEIIRPADVEMGVATESLRGIVPVAGLADAVGLELARGVAAGQPLDQRYLKPPVVVRRGESVTVYAKAAGVSVRTTAKAMDNGAVGDLIWLESLDNRQRYTARVTGLQQAEIYATGASASPGPRAHAIGRALNNTLRK
jgi:flagella basal body P-ring formation protein FlgA